MSSEHTPVIEALAKVCKEHGVTCLIQIGAEYGHEALGVAKHTGCRAVCIDGDSRCYCVGGDLEYHHLLIGAMDGPTTFHVHKEIGLSSTLLRDGTEPHEGRPMNKLDTFCAKHEIVPDALIIDTEGTTMDVLRGAEGVLGGVKVVYAECQTHNLEEVDGFLMGKGFVRRGGPPSYVVGHQGNYTWVRPCNYG